MRDLPEGLCSSCKQLHVLLHSLFLYVSTFTADYIQTYTSIALLGLFSCDKCSRVEPHPPLGNQLCICISAWIHYVLAYQ